MKHIAYADRKNDVNTALSLLLSSSESFFCYRCESGYGITAFFHRLCYLLQSTKNVVCLYAELSDNSRSPLNEALKKVAIKDGELYQTLQLYADEYYGEYSQTLFQSMLHDLPAFGETLAQLIDRPKAPPIYTGYYPDVIKNFFFDLVKKDLSDKTVILFVDNVQFIDNNSIYDMLALSEFENVKVVMSCTGNSKLSEKLLLEIDISNNLRYLDFSAPPAKCVQELWESNNKMLSEKAAKKLISQAGGNICQFLHEIFSRIIYSRINFKQTM